MVKLLPLLIFLFSCAHQQENKDDGEMKRREMSDYYSGTGIVRYFLPNIPAWANTSHSGKCHRKESIVLLDYEKLRRSYFLNYEQAVQFQLLFNRDLRRVMSAHQVNYLTFKKEEEIFYETSDRIQSNFKVFKEPKLKTVNIIWIDHALGDVKVLKRLNSLFKKKVMDEGHPIFLSMCLRREELIDFVRKNHLPRSGRYISYEMFSPFQSNNEKSYGHVLEVDQLFGKNYKLYFYSNTEIPFEVKGKVTLKKY